MNQKTLVASTAAMFVALSACSSMKGNKEAAGSVAKVECHGVNACKGQGECGGKGHACGGKNACKGQGWISMTKEECDSKGGKS